MSLNLAISVDVNAAIAADQDAAVGAATGLRLVGYNLRETAGAAATFKIVHGATVAGGTVVASVALAANESKEVWLWPGIPVASGLSIDRVAGAADVNLYHVTIT